MPAPRTLDLRSALSAYIDHQIEVVTRRTEYRLQKDRDRLHIVEGLLKALADAGARGKVDVLILVVLGARLEEGAAPVLTVGVSFETPPLAGMRIAAHPLHLALQAGRAQNRFYTELENWLSSVTDLESSPDDLTVLAIRRPIPIPVVPAIV